jgi:hypothetical protein
MAIRYICLDDKYLIPDPQWSRKNDGTDECYVKAEDFERVVHELNELRDTIRYLEIGRNS